LYAKVTGILAQLNQLPLIEADFLQAWLSKLSSSKVSSVMVDSSESDTMLLSDESLIASYTLKQLAIYLVQENDNSLSETVPLTVLSTLIQLGTNLINLNEGCGFPQLLSLMDLLASAGGGRGHLYLFQASCIWLEHLTSVDLESMIKMNTKKDFLHSATHVLSYVCDILNILRSNSNQSNSKASNNKFSFDATLNEDIHRIFQSKIIVGFSKNTEKVFQVIQQKFEASLLAKEKLLAAASAANKISDNKKRQSSSSKSKQQRGKSGQENFFDNDENMNDLMDNEDYDNDDQDQDNNDDNNDPIDDDLESNEYLKDIEDEENYNDYDDDTVECND
jgi:hypothetical protein